MKNSGVALAFETFSAWDDASARARADNGLSDFLVIKSIHIADPIEKVSVDCTSIILYFCPDVNRELRITLSKTLIFTRQHRDG